MPEWPQWVVTAVNALVFIVMAIGMFGSLIPFVPGPLIIWLSGLGYGVLMGFSTLGWWMFALMTILMLAGSLADNLFMGAGARRGGASWLAITIGLLGGVVGTLLLPPFGGLLAAPLAVYAFEVYRQGSHKGAVRAMRGMLTGWGLSFAARFLIGMVMILLWMVWAWRG